MTKYTNRLDLINEQIANLGTLIPDEWLLVALISGLRKEFDGMKRILNNRRR